MSVPMPKTVVKGMSRFSRAPSAYSRAPRFAEFLGPQIYTLTTGDDNGVNGDQQQQQTESKSSSSEAADATSTQSATFCDVCLVTSRDGVVLDSRLCTQCADTVAAMPTKQTLLLSYHLY